MIISRYLTKEVYATLLATTFILLLIFISNQFIHYLNQAASGGLPVRAVMQLMSLQVPLLLGYLLPLGLFLGILLAYGRLYVDQEMTVLAANGVSNAQLLRITLGFSTLIALVVSFLMLWVEPQLAWYREHIFAEAAVASPFETIFPQRFQGLADGQWVFYVNDVSRDRLNLQEVFAAKTPTSANPAWTIVSSDSGHQWMNPTTGDQFLALTSGYRYTGIPGQRNFQIVKYQEYDIRVQTQKLRMPKEVEYLSTWELWKRRHQDPLAATELQWRLTMPTATLILALLAVPLSQVRPRQGRYAKLLPAILFYIIYADLIFVTEAAMQHGKMPIFPGLWAIHLGMLVIALICIASWVGWKRVFFLLRNRKK